MIRPVIVSQGIVSHPFIASSVAELTSNMQAVVSEVFPPGDQIETIFVIPPTLYRIGTRIFPSIPEQVLLFTDKGLVYVRGADEAGGTITTYISHKTVFFSQVSIILLYGRLEIHYTEGGENRLLAVEYNAVRQDLLQPPLHAFLSRSAQKVNIKGEPADLEHNARQALRNLDMKYRNGLSLHSLIPDERLLGVLFQPATRRSLWLRSNKIQTRPFLLALTDRHLLMIGEEQGNHRWDYGWVISYHPIQKIHHLSITVEKKIVRLIIHLQGARLTERPEIQLNPAALIDFSHLWHLIYDLPHVFQAEDAMILVEEGKL